MRKTFSMENLGCANCAAAMERGIRKIHGVTDASVNFMLQRLTLEASDEAFDAALQQAAKVCQRVEKGCRIVYREAGV